MVIFWIIYLLHKRYFYINSSIYFFLENKKLSFPLKNFIRIKRKSYVIIAIGHLFYKSLKWYIWKAIFLRYPLNLIKRRYLLSGIEINWRRKFKLFERKAFDISISRCFIPDIESLLPPWRIFYVGRKK